MEDALLKAFGVHLKTLRAQRAISQEALALKAGLDRTYISGVERGLRNVSLINLKKLSVALGLSLSELMDFVESSHD